MTLRKLYFKVRFWWRDHRLGRCPRCGRFGLLHYTPSMTMYTDDALNETGHWCRTCKEDYCDYWSDRWQEYYGGGLL